MEPETKAKVMFGVLGLICGGIIAMIIGFNWGYGTNNTSDYVRKHGWDKMPGEEKAAPDVAYVCAKGIEVIIKKGDK
jgi:hypothetical protein